MSRRDTFYFPHEYNAKDDPKCERLIFEMGVEGYGIFWSLLEVLRAQPDYTYPLENIPLVAYKYRTDSGKVRRVVFDFGLFNVVDDKIFFSNGLIRRMQPMDQRRHKQSEGGKEGAKKRWENGGKNSLPNGYPINLPNGYPYSNKSRVNKIREEESKGDCKREPANAEGNDTSVTTSADKPRRGTTKRGAFVVPAIEIVKDYFSTIKGGDTDAECFYDYFAANGWRTGKNPLKDWEAAARNWMRRKSEFSNTTQNQTNHETKRVYKDL